MNKGNGRNDYEYARKAAPVITLGLENEFTLWE
jgi:hypothetical protein